MQCRIRPLDNINVLGWFREQLFLVAHRIRTLLERDGDKCNSQKHSENHLWLHRDPLVVLLLDQIRPLLLENHRDDSLFDRVVSESGWMFGLLDLFLPNSLFHFVHVKIENVSVLRLENFFCVESSSMDT